MIYFDKQISMLINEFLTDVTLKIRFKYTVSRNTYSDKMAGTIMAEPSYDLTAEDPARAGLIAMLESNASNRVELPHLFPKFLKVIVKSRISFLKHPNIGNSIN